MRYERKYKTEHLAFSLVEQSIRLHPAGFQKIYPDRQVNNIYFDSLNLKAFKENAMGIAERKKFRIRWYGENLQQIKNPFFEIKIKNNQLGDKISAAIPDFELSNLDDILTTIQIESKSFETLQPTLLNSYWRSYYGTFDGKYRITIDQNMRYFPLLNRPTFDSYSIEDQGVVMELKYEEDLDGLTDRVTQHLPFRMTKSSKYVTGMELVNF